MIKDNEGKFRVKHLKHIRPVFIVKREQYLAVAVALEGITLFDKLVPKLFEAVDLAVTDKERILMQKGLHPFGRKPHDRKALEAHYPFIRDP